MAYDNEQMRAAPWKPEYGSRIFKHDVLLSYRRSDLTAARRLADLMRSAKTTVWWDEEGDEDLDDRRLIEKIGHGIFHSRYIVVCLSSTSTLSEWMEAEFGKALSRGRQGAYTRVLVALLDQHASVPKTLVDCPVFATWTNGASILIDFVKRGNRFDFVSKETQEAVSRAFFTKHTTPDQISSRDAEISYIERILRLPWRIGDSDSDEFCYPLQSLRNWIARIEGNALESVPGLISMVLEACFHPAFSKNTDNRANAIGTIVLLAQLGYRDAWTWLIFFLSREGNAGVISITFRWIEQHFTDLTNLEQEVALLAVARAPNEAEMSFKNSFISSLPEAVRCRLNTGRDLDSAALSRDERLRLATSRIDLLLAEDPSNINYAYFQEEFARMRDAALTFLKGAPHPKAAAPELISSAFDVIQRVIHSSEKREGYPLTTIDLIYDQLLTPVAMCYADRQHAERARELFDYACKVLVISKNVTKNKVAAYRVLLTALEQGVPFDEAEAQATEALGQAYKVDEKVAGAKMGEGLFK